MMSADSQLDRVQTPEDNNLVRPGEEFCSLLRLAGATKEVFTMKEVMFYLGQYIIQKQLYDQKQQHIVHCSQDALGRVLGVDSFSVKEPQVLFAMITKNLVALSPVRPSDCPGIRTGVESGASDGGPQEVEKGSCSSSPEPRRRRRRSHRSSDPGPSCGVAEDEEQQSEEESEDEGRKRRRSDSYSLTFDDSLSWCVIGGLGSGCDRHSSQSSDSHSVSARSEVTGPPSESDSDNFSVEFEVESIDSDDYNEDDASLSADDQVYEVIFEAEDDDSFDEDTEISEADYWRCAHCEELNPPLPRNCLRCWTLRDHWLPELSVTPAPCNPQAPPPKLADQSISKDTAGVSLKDMEDQDGVDIPDGRRAKTPTCQSQSDSQDLFSSQPSSSLSSQDKPWTLESPSSPLEPAPPGSSSPSVPDLERSVSSEWRLPDSCLDPCLICQSRPKNGCIVHGKTGHLMSCYTCAKKLKRRNKLCPVCRLPIQTVVLTYLS